jgi:rare lipoprotein A
MVASLGRLFSSVGARCKGRMAAIGPLSGGVRLSAALLACAVLAGCATTRDRPVSDTPVRIGPAYAVRGKTYVPAAAPAYDVLGFATWYGSESGSQTANGERFRPEWITAGHRTLPLPSYVEITSLETGRTILVRVNDRGPFGNDWRIIDLSRGAADQLGVRRQGIVPVRVRVVDPPAKDKARLREGMPADERARVAADALGKLRAQLRAGCTVSADAPPGC